jgi:outer membrane assembly lipoprotein YfiO
MSPWVVRARCWPREGTWRLVARVAVLLLAGCAGAPRIKVGPTYEDKLEAARTLIDEGRHDEAVEILDNLRDLNPPVEIQGEVSFLLGKSEFLSGHHRRCVGRYKRFVKDQPYSPRLPEVEELFYQSALVYLDGRGKGFLGLPSPRSEGVSVLEYLRETFPRGHRAADVLRLLGQIAFDQRRWEDAVFEYQALAEDFPSSEWKPLADYRIGLCYLLQNRGPEYDRELLVKSRYAFSDYLDRYPEGTYKAEATAALDLISDMLEQRAYQIGRFYEKRHRPRAASLSYERALVAFPDSEQAEKARRRIQALVPRVRELEEKEKARMAARKKESSP